MATAQVFDQPKSTLAYRLGGERVSRQVAHVEQQLLTPVEGGVIVRWIKRLEDWGFLPRLDMVKGMAQMLVWKKKVVLIGPPVGKQWIMRFLSHHPDIASRYSENLDCQHAYAHDPNKIKDNFRKFNRLRISHNLQPGDIYNLDEKGFMMGMSAKTKVVPRVGRRNSRVTQDGKRELITDLETICGDGSSMAPFLFFKAKAGHSMGWYARLDNSNMLLAYSNKGWTDDSVGYQYISRHFIKFAHPPPTPHHNRLIILHCHSSYINWDFCMFCLEYNIILLSLPAHSTHLLQPLDVAVFSPL